MMAAVPTSALRRQPAPIMCGLGVISALFTIMVGLRVQAPWFVPGGFVFLDVIGPLFGATIGLGLWSWTAKWWAVPALAATTQVAWCAAVPLALGLQGEEVTAPSVVIAGLVSGGVGAGLTHLGCAVLAPELRRPLSIALTCAAGALLGGVFLYMLQRRLAADALLFLVWQPAVALAIGIGLGRGSRAV
jgi:hypothetical protein